MVSLLVDRQVAAVEQCNGIHSLARSDLDTIVRSAELDLVLTSDRCRRDPEAHIARHEQLSPQCHSGHLGLR